MATVETVNARSVFAAFDPAPHDEEDQATLLFRPARRAAGGRHASNFPPPIRAAVVPAIGRPTARRDRSEMPPPAGARSASPHTLRTPVLSLETVSALPPRTVIVATESTPAMALGSDSGEYTPSTPTMPVPRMPVAASKLPFLAAGMLALAAGAMVALLAGPGRKVEDPAAWATVATTSSLATPKAAATAPGPAAMVRAPEPVVSAEPVFERPVPEQIVVSARKAPAKPAVAVVMPAPMGTKSVSKASPTVAEPKPAKPAKGAADDEVAKAKADANAAAATLGDSL